MQVLIDLYYVMYIAVGVTVILGIVYRNLKTQLQLSWKKDIEKNIDELEKHFSSTCNERMCKERVNNIVSSKFDMVSKDLLSMKETVNEIKVIITNQQETLLAIQLGLTELKPRIDSLEKRVEKIENKIEK
jgi:peptidoglycan hydrolase CwlO-like protein